MTPTETVTAPALDLPDLVTRAQLSAFTGLSVATLARWAMEGDKGPRITKLGSAVRYRRDDIVAWLDSQRL